MSAAISFSLPMTDLFPSPSRKEKYSFSPLPVTAFSGTSKLRAKAIGAGDHHSVVLSQDGRVFTFGASSNGRLGKEDHITGGSQWGKKQLTKPGLGIETENQFEPRQAKLSEGVCITHISVGRNHALLLSREGKVFSFGYGFYGKLGHGDQKTRTEPTEVACLLPARAKAVFAGGNASFVLT